MPYGGYRGFPRAQYVPNSQMYANPAYRIGPNFTPINQAACNTSTMGRAGYAGGFDLVGALGVIEGRYAEDVLTDLLRSRQGEGQRRDGGQRRRSGTAPVG